jgi:hypothetical protein
MFTTHCDQCHAANQVPPAYRGTMVQCQSCFGRFMALSQEERAFKFPCPSCHGNLEALFGDIGLPVECPHCSRLILIPDPAQPAAPPPEIPREPPPPSVDPPPAVPFAVADRPPADVPSGNSSTVITAMVCFLVLAVGFVWFLEKKGSSTDSANNANSSVVQGVVDFKSKQNYYDEIKLIREAFQTGDTAAENAPQQWANAGYRLGDSLSVMARQLDQDGSSVKFIENLIAYRNSVDNTTKTTFQQTANGIYRCVEFLVICVNEANNQISDYSQRNSNRTDIILIEAKIKVAASMASGEDQTADEQIAQGTERMAELITVLARIIDIGKDDTAAISLYEAAAKPEADGGSLTDYQKSVRSLYASCRLMTVIIKRLEGQYDSITNAYVDAELDALNSSDQSAESVLQQIALGLNTLTRLTMAASQGLNP